MGPSTKAGGAARPSKVVAGSSPTSGSPLPRTIPAFLGPRAVAGLAHHATHDIELSSESVKEELPRILQQLVAPVGGSAAQEAVVRRHFANAAQMSHPVGFAIGAAQIACMLTCLYLWRSILFPEVDIIPVMVVFDPDRLSAAMDVKAVLRLRWVGLRLPLLAQVFCELAPRREKGSSGLVITYWSEHYSLRSLAVMLPGRLVWLADWVCRRAVAVGSERLLRLMARLGWAQWAQHHSI